MKYILRLVGISLLTLTLGMNIACKKDKPAEPSAEQYVKKIAELAEKYSKDCPKPEPNGATLKSVTFADKTMTFRVEISDEAIALMTKERLDSAIRDSLISHMSDKLKTYLVKGDCEVTYKYVSPNDSCSLTIIPKELSVESEVEVKEKK